jgi:endoglucanase
MRQCNWVCLVLGLSLLFWSCGDDKDDPIPEKPVVAELSVSPTTLHFSKDGGEQSISITSNTTWKIDFTGVTWVRPSISVSMGSANVKVAADANDVEEERTAVFKVSAEGAEEVSITITQAAKDPEVQEPVFEYEAYIEPDNTDMRDMTAMELSALMGVGWNLGNALEAITVNDGVYSGGETSWGNPVVSKGLIDAVKAAGFNTIRIPVSWSHKLADKQNNLIALAWLQRVEEVLNYALDNDMFVKINVHWDGGWMDHPDFASQEAINSKLATLWEQIGAYFRDYDDRLLFAGTNEVHVDGDYGTPSSENLEVQNSFNQTFVTTIRATGGRNHYRHLVVQGFNTNINHTYNGFVMPDDEVENRLMAEVHYYDPYEFALNEKAPFNTLWGEPYAEGDVTNWGQEAWVNEAFGMMKEKFVDKGVPVIIGEYGAIHRTDLIGEAYTAHKASREYYLEYVTRAMIQNGLIPVYWDNGHAGDNGFALFNRSSGAVVDQGALDAIIRGSTLEE